MTVNKQIVTMHMESSDEKLCRICDTVQPLTAFKHKKTHCYECQKKMSRDWKAKNKERQAAYTKKWKEEHATEVKAYNAAYFVANRATIQTRSTAYHNERSKTDPNFKLAKTLRGRIYGALKGAQKSDHTLTLLGCPMEFLKAWLEFRFKPGMTLQNHGKVWHLDHVVACACFDLTDEEEQRKCFHWSNFQPLFGQENQEKNCYVTEDEIGRHEQMLTEFLASLPTHLGLHFTLDYTIIDINRYNYVNA